jgi:hypothetical protein
VTASRSTAILEIWRWSSPNSFVTASGAAGSSAAATRFESGGAAPGDLASFAAVRSAVLSGAIKGPIRFW